MEDTVEVVTEEGRELADALSAAREVLAAARSACPQCRSRGSSGSRAPSVAGSPRAAPGPPASPRPRPHSRSRPRPPALRRNPDVERGAAAKTAAAQDASTSDAEPLLREEATSSTAAAAPGAEGQAEDRLQKSSSSFFFGECDDDGEGDEEFPCFTGIVYAAAAAASEEAAGEQEDDCNFSVLCSSTTSLASKRAGGELPTPTASVTSAAGASLRLGETLVTDEGAALAQALREAQAALDHARQFVTSPCLDRPATGAEGQLPSEVADTPVPQNAPEVLVLDPSVEDKKPCPQHVNALHARFGTNVAQSRISRAQEQVRESKAKQRQEAQRQILQDAADAVKGEELRQRAARRVASERRRKREDRFQEEEEKAMMAARHKADAAVSQRYSKCAARRAKSEQLRRHHLEREVIAEIQEAQRKRREESDAKGEALQRRCEEADWSNCKPVVDAKPMKRPPPRGPYVATARSTPSSECGKSGCDSARSGESCSLPRIIPPAAPRIGPDVRQGMMVRQKASDLELTRLPVLVPSV